MMFSLLNLVYRLSRNLFLKSIFTNLVKKLILCLVFVLNLLNDAFYPIFTLSLLIENLIPRWIVFSLVA